MDLQLNDKKALVCGASRGLGYAVARALLNEGVEVIIAARGGEGLEQAASRLAAETGSRPRTVAADLTKPADRARLVAEAERLLTTIDILVPNAGGPPTGRFMDFGEAEWQLAVDLEIGMLTHLCRLVLPGMAARGFGRITQIVSIAAYEVMEGLVLSNATRPAVLGLAKALAREVAPQNILVNSICPGLFLTDRVRHIAADQARAAGVTTEAVIDGFSRDIPLGRLGDPAELGDLAAFLSSPRNTYITGAAIAIDGGKTRRLY